MYLTSKQKTKELKRINDNILRSKAFLDKEVQSSKKLKKDEVVFPKLLNVGDKTNITQKDLDKEYRKQSISFHPDRPPRIDKLQKYSEIVGDNKIVKNMSPSDIGEYQQQAFDKLTEAKEGLLELPTKIETTKKKIAQLNKSLNTLKKEHKKASQQKTLKENVFQFVKSPYQRAKTKAPETKESAHSTAKTKNQKAKTKAPETKESAHSTAKTKNQEAKNKVSLKNPTLKTTKAYPGIKTPEEIQKILRDHHEGKLIGKNGKPTSNNIKTPSEIQEIIDKIPKGGKLQSNQTSTSYNSSVNKKTPEEITKILRDHHEGKLIGKNGEPTSNNIKTPEEIQKIIKNFTKSQATPLAASKMKNNNSKKEVTTAKKRIGKIQR